MRLGKRERLALREAEAVRLAIIERGLRKPAICASDCGGMDSSYRKPILSNNAYSTLMWDWKAHLSALKTKPKY